VAVAVGFGRVRVGLGLAVGVRVGIRVGVRVAVRVGDAFEVGVGVGVTFGVRVGLAVAPTHNFTRFGIIGVRPPITSVTQALSIQGWRKARA
jgi:hypothetical protein